MSKSYIIFILITTLFFGACKKDLLHWQSVQELNSHTNSQLTNIHSLDGTTFIGAGGDIWSKSVIIRSTDGGYTWTCDSVPACMLEMYGMSIADNGTLYLSGFNGSVLISKDSGLTWQYKFLGNWLEYFGGTFVTPDTGIFISSVLMRQSTITRLNATFKKIDDQTYQFGLNNIYFTSQNTGFVLGYGTIMKTTNRGNTWQYLDVSGDNYTAMAVLNDDIWVCGSNGGIYRSTDAGNHWQCLRNGNDITHPHYSLRTIYFINPREGWAAGDDGKVIYTRDGGDHWSEFDRFTTSSIRCISPCPFTGDLLICGDNGRLFRVYAQ